MNKYQTPAESYHGRSYELGSHLNYDIKGSVYGFPEAQTWEQFAFFTHYERHSKQLVDAFQKWVKSLAFETCEYSGGELRKENQNFVEPQVRYMDYMQIHLDAAYKDFPDPHIIQLKRKRICNEISHLMIGQIPHRPSFDMMITGRIKTDCPSLEKSGNPDLKTNNMYIHSYVCNIIFEVINGKRKLSLTVRRMSLDNEYDLVHKNSQTIARGDEQSILKLKTIMEEFVHSEKIRDIINQYHQLKKRLEYDIEVKNLRKFADDLLTIIYGGKLLGGYGSCPLCHPGELGDVEIK